MQLLIFVVDAQNPQFSNQYLTLDYRVLNGTDAHTFLDNNDRIECTQILWNLDGNMYSNEQVYQKLSNISQFHKFLKKKTEMCHFNGLGGSSVEH